VAIGRAIVRDPKVFLFDEPLSNLDAALRNDMRLELSQLHARLGATMVYVTHDQVEAMTMADFVVVLNKGRIEQSGPPMTLYQSPASLFVARFIGSPQMNIFEGEVAARHGARYLGVRPEHLRLAPQDGAWSLRVTHVERLGADTVIHGSGLGQDGLILRAPGETVAAPGETLRITPDPQQLHLFDDAGRRIVRPESGARP
jgi:ABC-type sugar transport system ATPase subunit